MPTGYTACIDDGATFEQFVWRCARGMGACIMMRDDPWDKPIPESFEPSKYYFESVESAEKKLAAINAMTVEEITERQVADNAAIRVNNERRRTEREEQKRNYAAIKAKVEAWTPPTADHEGLRSFMLEQLETGKPYEAWQENENTIVEPEEWRQAQIEKVMQEVARAKDEWNKEQERTAGRNGWIKQLRDSIPQPTPFKKAA